MRVYLGVFIVSLFILTGCQPTRKSSASKYKRPPSRTATARPSAPAARPAYRDPEKKPASTYTYKKANGLVTSRQMQDLINEWLGVPHRVGGKDKSGIDCSGFTSVVYRQIYRKGIAGSSADMARMATLIPREDLTEGDLVFFKINGDRVSHVGVYLSNDYFVHATLRRGVMISSLDEDYYTRYFYSAGRIESSERGISSR